MLKVCQVCKTVVCTAIGEIECIICMYLENTITSGNPICREYREGLINLETLMIFWLLGVLQPLSFDVQQSLR